MADLNNKFKIPCDGCAHNDVCGIKDLYLSTKVESEHPYITVQLGCTKYMNAASFKSKEE